MSSACAGTPSIRRLVCLCVQASFGCWFCTVHYLLPDYCTVPDWLVNWSSTLIDILDYVLSEVQYSSRHSCFGDFRTYSLYSLSLLFPWRGAMRTDCCTVFYRCCYHWWYAWLIDAMDDGWHFLNYMWYIWGCTVLQCMDIVPPWWWARTMWRYVRTGVHTSPRVHSEHSFKL